MRIDVVNNLINKDHMILKKKKEGGKLRNTGVCVSRRGSGCRRGVGNALHGRAAGRNRFHGDVAGDDVLAERLYFGGRRRRAASALVLRLLLLLAGAHGSVREKTNKLRWRKTQKNSGVSASSRCHFLRWNRGVEQSAENDRHFLKWLS